MIARYALSMKHIYDDRQTNFHSAKTWHLLIRYTAFAAQIIVLGQYPKLILVNHLNFTPVTIG